MAKLMPNPKLLILSITIKILRNNPSKFVLKLATITLIFQRNQSILHQLTLKTKILIMITIMTSYPIKVLPMNLLITMIQIKLHLTITINSIERCLSDSIIFVESLNVQSCHCITRLESLKDKFSLKAIHIKRNLVL